MPIVRRKRGRELEEQPDGGSPVSATLPANLGCMSCIPCLSFPTQLNCGAAADTTEVDAEEPTREADHEFPEMDGQVRRSNPPTPPFTSYHSLPAHTCLQFGVAVEPELESVPVPESIYVVGPTTHPRIDKLVWLCPECDDDLVTDIDPAAIRTCTVVWLQGQTLRGDHAPPLPPLPPPPPT